MMNLCSLLLLGYIAAANGDESQVPSPAPSVFASDFPSDIPSNVPSLVPTTDSSLAPSVLPTIIGSNSLPTSQSPMPSDMPSMVPSLAPTSSRAPSGSPSSAPSPIPSSVPTASPIPSSTPSGSSKPTTVPTVAPTHTPSLQPSVSPSSLPTARPSSTPTAMPSDSPTPPPSASPSSAPTTAPSSSPSSSPSVAPTASPSAAPSASPSSSPTSSPSASPSAAPTASPSASPSSSPTSSCHDVQNYRSPINGFSCGDHNGTDCIQWRHLGLSIDDVEALIDNCPISCHVECGTSLRFETTFSFKLWNIDTFLSPEEVDTLNEVAIDFMTDYVTELEPESDFFVYETVLLSQQVAGEVSNRRLRSLQDASGSLLLDVGFRVYAINLDKVTIDNRLRDGLFSPAFTQALQRSGDETFIDTQVSVVGGNLPPQQTTEDSGRSGSSAGISAAIIGSIALLAGGGCYLFRTKTQNDKNKAFIRENQAVFTSFPLSPNQSVQSPTSSFSFDATSNLVSRMARIVTSFSPRSDYDEAGEITNTESSESNERIMSHADIDLGAGMIEEVDEEESFDEEEELEGIHPYAGIVPPMIVIDRIESESDIYTEDDDQGHHRRVKSVVPSVRLDASSDFVAALNDRSKPFDPAAFSSFIQNNTPVADEEQSQQKDTVDQIRGGPSFNMFSSNEDDDGASKCSNPDSSDALFDRLRKGEGSETDDSSGPSWRSKHGLTMPVMTRPPRIPSEGSIPMQKSSPRSANTSPVVTREKLAADGYHSDDNMAREIISKKDAPSFLHSLWSRSPHGRTAPSGSKSDTSGESRRWGSHRRTSSKGSYGTLGSLEEEGSILTFHAPKGQLGLVIECSSESTPIIAQVKDYSPLLGQVLQDDKIVMIDGTHTDKLGMSEVTSLLEGKSNRATSVRLKVFRATDPNQLQSPTVSHVSYDGTSSLGTASFRHYDSMSDQESPIHHGHKTASNILVALPIPRSPMAMIEDVKTSKSD